MTLFLLVIVLASLRGLGLPTLLPDVPAELPPAGGSSGSGSRAGLHPSPGHRRPD